MRKNNQKNWFALICATSLLCTGAVWAQTAETVLVKDAKDQRLQITVGDVNADALAVPDDMRAHALSDPDKVKLVTQGLYIYRGLALQAKDAGLDKDPVVQKRLQAAADKVLSEVRLENLRKEVVVSEAAQERYAQMEYKNNPNRFDAPFRERASQILIMGDSEADKTLIDDLYAKAKRGENFGELAYEFSQDPASAAVYGDLGFFTAGEMVPEFSKAVSALKNKGDISEPFKSEFGWHIVRLDDRREAGKLVYDEAKPILKQEAVDKAFEDAKGVLINKIADSAQFDAAAYEAFAKSQPKPALPK